MLQSISDDRRPTNIDVKRTVYNQLIYKNNRDCLPETKSGFQSAQQVNSNQQLASSTNLLEECKDPYRKIEVDQINLMRQSHHESESAEMKFQSAADNQ